MKLAWQITKGVFFLLVLGFVFYIIWDYTNLTTKYHLPSFLIPAISVPTILAIGFKFIELFYRVGQIEYEFTSVVNHTFRTPLTRVMWYAKELEKDLPSSERVLYVQNLSNAATRVLDIVDIFAGIKNINDRSGYFFQATSLRDIVEKTIAKYREEINKRKLTFHISTFKDAPLLTIDLKKISFVIDALIENAIFYTPNGGEVTVDFNIVGSKLKLSVKDTGMGLTTADKMRIFDRFYRNKRAVLMNPDGMGLKLYLSNQIVKRHHGKIEKTSAGKDKGSTFYMVLPLS